MGIPTPCLHQLASSHWAFLSSRGGRECLRWSQGHTGTVSGFKALKAVVGRKACMQIQQSQITCKKSIYIYICTWHKVEMTVKNIEAKHYKWHILTE